MAESTSELRKTLKRYYKSYLLTFDNWVQEKGPVSIGCIDTQLVIIILKEFIPNFICKKQIIENTTETTQKESETRLLEIQELVDSMITDIESGKVVMKKRKFDEELPNFWEPLGVPPIFLIKTRKSLLGKKLPKNGSNEQNKEISKISKEERAEKKEKKIKDKSEKSEKKVKIDATEKKEKIDKVDKIDKKIRILKPKKIKNESDLQPQKSVLLIPNPMTEEFRNKDPCKMGYRTDFKKGYLPIEMQEEHEKLEQIHIQHESKSHFIRKKQSAVNIKRSCGVTYIKPTESKQKGVIHEFEPLPPLAFQVGTVERIIPADERSYYFALAEDIIKDIFSPGKVLRTTVQTDCLEEDMKKSLLGVKSLEEEIFVDNIKEF